MGADMGAMCYFDRRLYAQERARRLAEAAYNCAGEQERYHAHILMEHYEAYGGGMGLTHLTLIEGE